MIFRSDTNEFSVYKIFAADNPIHHKKFFIINFNKQGRIKI